jgi:hypothetical protein
MEKFYVHYSNEGKALNFVEPEKVNALRLKGERVDGEWYENESIARLALGLVVRIIKKIKARKRKK